MSLYRPRKRQNQINIVPLIDVMTVLIFFFLMTMRFDEIMTLDISPPSAESATPEYANGTGAVVVAISKKGTFFYNKQEVTKQELARRLTDLGKKLPGHYIFVVADGQTFTQDALYAVDQANKADLRPRLVTQSSR
ncbi:MAG: biopolymer transporter ExbD [Puniceicoccales bacterium]|jgi:biopolymer transport protein ExbD|nr:biopolymer transporter ExbD [Puniceicoccales bacterium]